MMVERQGPTLRRTRGPALQGFRGQGLMIKTGWSLGKDTYTASCTNNVKDAENDESRHLRINIRI